MVNSKCVCISAEKEMSFSAINDFRFTLNDSHFFRVTETFSEPFQTSKTKLFAKIDNG